MQPSFPLRTPCVLSAFLLSTLLSACYTKSSEYQLRKSYQYRIILRLPGVEYQLRDKQWRFSQFHGRQVPPNPQMLAYFIEYHGGGGCGFFSPPKSSQLDTVEVAVTSVQADSLFRLTQRFFLTLQPSNLDTIRQGQQEYFQTDDVGGQLQLYWNGQRLLGEVDPLHASSVTRQSRAFWHVHGCFDRLFVRAATKNVIP